MWAITQDGTIVDITSVDPAGRYHPEFAAVMCPDGARIGDTIANGALVPRSVAPPVVRYVSLATIQDRVAAAGKWDVFTAALDALPSDKRWRLHFLSEGILPSDPDAIALLSGIGCDPAAILAA